MRLDFGLLNIQEKLGSDYQLPALSVIALRLVELASDDTKSASELASWLEKDPALASRVIKMANSAYFPKTRPVSTLKEAIVRIGFERLRMMALSISLRDTFPMSKVGPLDCELFWKVSIYRAVLGREIARKLKSCDPEEAFLAGLIMEIGLLVLVDVFLKKKGVEFDLDLLRFNELILLEEDTFGINHRQIGEFLLTRWKFPDEIIKTQKVGMPGMDIDAYSPLQKVCHMAMVLSKIPMEEGGVFERPYNELKWAFGLEPEVVDEILFESIYQVEGMAEVMKIHMSMEKDVLGIMEKANRTLLKISERLMRGMRGTDELPTMETLRSEGVDKRFLDAIAHEIRNPLLAVGGFARRLAKSLEPESKGAVYAGVLIKEAERLERLLEDLKELSLQKGA